MKRNKDCGKVVFVVIMKISQDNELKFVSPKYGNEMTPTPFGTGQDFVSPRTRSKLRYYKILWKMKD